MNRNLIISLVSFRDACNKNEAINRLHIAQVPDRIKMIYNQVASELEAERDKMIEEGIKHFLEYKKERK